MAVLIRDYRGVAFKKLAIESCTLVLLGRLTPHKLVCRVYPLPHTSNACWWLNRVRFNRLSSCGKNRM